MLKVYHEYSLHFQVRSNGEFLASLIMYNGNILINNEVITRRDFIRNKIFNVNCFMKENSEFLTLREFFSKFNLRLVFLTYHGLIRAIGRYKNSLSGQRITLMCMHFLRTKVAHLAYIKGF